MDEFGTAKKETGFLHSISPSTPLPIFIDKYEGSQINVTRFEGRIVIILNLSLKVIIL